MSPSVLLVGLAWSGPEDAPEKKLVAGADTYEKLANQVTTAMEEARSAGYEVQNLQIHHGNYDADIEAIKNRLKEQRFDLFMIGFGVRAVPEYTWIFEALINAGREIAPGMRIGFNTGPRDVFKSIQRNVV